jgi:hypothetical protein
LQDEWNKIFKVMKEKQPTKLSFKNDGEIEVSPAKQKLREFVTYLTKILRMILEIGMKIFCTAKQTETKE